MATLFALAFLGLAVLSCGADEEASGQESTGRFPTAAAPAGWERFAASGIEVWLPSSYEGGEPSKGDLDAIVDALKLTGRSDFASYVEAVKSAFVLLMIDNDLANVGASVSVAKAPAPSALGLEAIVEANIRQLPAGVVIMERRPYTLGNRPAVRLALEIDADFGTVSEFLYVFKSVNAYWVVVYAAPKSAFERNIPIFEESASRLRISD